MLAALTPFLSTALPVRVLSPSVSVALLSPAERTPSARASELAERKQQQQLEAAELAAQEEKKMKAAAVAKAAKQNRKRVQRQRAAAVGARKEHVSGGQFVFCIRPSPSPPSWSLARRKRTRRRRRRSHQSSLLSARYDSSNTALFALLRSHLL